MEKKCPFCEIVLLLHKKNDDFSWGKGKSSAEQDKMWKSSLILSDLVLAKEGENLMTIADKNPRTKGHFMIFPKLHYHHLNEINTKDWNDILIHSKNIINKICRVYSPAGFNIYAYSDGKNGSLQLQSVAHCHLHVLPIYQKTSWSPKKGWTSTWSNWKSDTHSCRIPRKYR